MARSVHPTLIRDIKRCAPYFVPILEAVQRGARCKFYTPALGFIVSPGQPRCGEIVLVGDDLMESVGPSGFCRAGRKQVTTALRKAQYVSFVSCIPLLPAYLGVANTAMAGDTAVLIEAREETENEWRDFIERYRHPDSYLLLALSDLSPGPPVNCWAEVLRRGAS